MQQTLKERITSALLEKNLLTQEQLNEALELQSERGGKLSQILVDLELVNEQDLISILSQHLNIPTISLSKYKIDPILIDLIPRKLARRYEIIPISKIENNLTIAMADPLNLFALDEVTSLTGFQVRVVIASAREILKAIEDYYSPNTHKALEQVVMDIQQGEELETEVLASKERDADELRQMTNEDPVVKSTNIIIAEATQLKSSDIFIEPLEDRTRIRYRVDGLLKEARTIPKKMHEAIVSRIKIMSELKIAEHRMPQDGRFKLKIKDRFVDFRVSTLPSSFGEKVTLRILDKTNVNLDIEALGFESHSLEALKEAVNKPHGMILTCGPTGSGKTTSLYSMLSFVDSPDLNILTAEDPVEYDLPGINQVNAKPEIGLTFARTLRSMLRQDPDIIMVGEIRDYETADIAVKSALTGHLVLSTLHTNSAAGAVTRLVNMGIEPFLISSSVILIAAQRLIRKLCDRCKEEYTPTEAMIKEFKLPKLSKGKHKIFKPVGCDACFKTGYKGRIGIIETISLTPKLRALVMDNASEYNILSAARKEGTVTLREDGINKTLAGITSLEEVARLTIADKDEKAEDIK